MAKEYKVYSITNIITNEKYIGLTSQNLKRRLKNGNGYKPMTKIRKAIEKYGWGNFKVEVLFESYCRKEAEEKEIYYIEFFDTVKNGYNKQAGGYKSTGYTVDKTTKEKLSNIHKGKHYSPKTEFKKGIAFPSLFKKVQCIETNEIFDNIKEARKKMKISNHIGDACSGKRNMCGGYHWKYVEEG